MKTVSALLVFATLAVVAIEGLPGIDRQRCLCLDNGLKRLDPKQILKIEIHPASPSCGRLEIIAVLKNGKKCLNPVSPFVKRLIDIIAKKTRSAQ